MSDSTVNLLQPISDWIRKFADGTIDLERKNQIETGAAFIASKIGRQKNADVVFICTHNSRRSQLAHVWASVAAAHFGLAQVRSFSGGTEVTACNERTVASLQRFGFDIDTPVDGSDSNPKYLVRYSPDAPPIECDSKLFTSIETRQFAAMMCCADVDGKCPIVTGAAIRIAWHYDDPKVADDTSAEESRYDERSEQIGADMYRMMAKAKHLLDQAR